jgi:hypothetical protein
MLSGRPVEKLLRTYEQWANRVRPRTSLEGPEEK